MLVGGPAAAFGAGVASGAAFDGLSTATARGAPAGNFATLAAAVRPPAQPAEQG